MNTTARLLYRLTANRPCRLINTAGKPYLERYYLFRVFGITVYLHRFVRNDSDHALHNHPWRHAVSLVLTGAYTAEQPGHVARLNDGTHLLYPLHHWVRWVNYIRHSTFHQIVAVRPETWTLFMHTRWRYEWGFLKPQDWGYRFQASTPRPTREWWHTAPNGRDAGREPLTERG